MTTNDRDLDRLLDRWFTDGPGEAPDRLLDDVVGRITRERQRPGWRVGPWRWPTAPTAIRLTAVAAALVALLALGVFVGGGGPAPLPVPSPTAPPTPEPTPAVLAGPMASLAPGDYAFINNGGRTEFTVPDGWSVPTLGGLDFSLAPIGAAAGDTIRVFYDMRVAAKDETCPEQPEPGIDASAAAIVGDIAANPGVDASTPEPITIGGLDGLMVDLALADGWSQSCPFDPGSPAVPLIVDTLPSEGPYWGVGGDNRQRLIVLDHPSVDNIVLLIESADGTTFDALTAAAMPVLQTFTFE